MTPIIYKAINSTVIQPPQIHSAPCTKFQQNRQSAANLMRTGRTNEISQPIYFTEVTVMVHDPYSTDNAARFVCDT